MEQNNQDNKVDIVKDQNSLLVFGIIYIIILALLIWAIYGFRMIQITQANSKINSIKKEITNQVSEEELAQLETISGQMATLYGKPFTTLMLKNIADSTPKTTILSNITLAGNQITIQGAASSYSDVSLFVTALNQKQSNLKNVEIANAAQSLVSGQGEINFTLQANLQ